MATALIGYTGFVGSNLAEQHHFDDLYNSSNIGDIAGKEYDLVVSAANRAEMWRINQEPAKDLAEIEEFIAHISQAKIKKLVLVSTVGVYKEPNGADENTPITLDGLPPYGVNRFHLEEFCRDNYDSLIVRLPGLFGKGLKKNVIYDLLHDNNVDRIHHAGSYQYYDLGNIWRDITIAREAGLALINLATEPVRTDEVAREAFGIEDFSNEPEGVTPASFDMHTAHAQVFGKSGPYVYSKAEVLEAIKQFVEAERAA